MLEEGVELKFYTFGIHFGPWGDIYTSPQESGACNTLISIN